MSSPVDPLSPSHKVSTGGSFPELDGMAHFSPPGGHAGFFLPAVQITIVSMFAGMACFLWAAFASPARNVFAQPVPPLWAVSLDLVVALFLALRVGGRPGSRLARLWPLVLFLLSAPLFFWAVRSTAPGMQETPGADRWTLLTHQPWKGGWIDPTWQALVLAVFVALVPLFFRLMPMRVHSSWIRRMGVAATLVVVLFLLPAGVLQAWALTESGRIVENEIARLSAVREEVEEAGGKQSKREDTVKLSQTRTGGFINERAVWTAADAVGRTKGLKDARDGVAVAISILRKRIQCPPVPPVVPPPSSLSRPTFGVYSSDDSIVDYLNKVEDTRDKFTKEREIAEGKLSTAARLCGALFAPKGIDTVPLACEMAEEDLVCPRGAAAPNSGALAGIPGEDIVPGASLYPFVDDVFFKTLFGKNKRALVANGCYPVPAFPFNVMFYCNVYSRRDAQGARVRYQTWAAMGLAEGSPPTDMTVPSQLFVTISTAGGTGARIHGKVFDDFARKALADQPPYDASNCERGSCFLVDHGTERIQVERHRGQESRGVLQLRALVRGGRP